MPSLTNREAPPTVRWNAPAHGGCLASLHSMMYTDLQPVRLRQSDPSPELCCTCVTGQGARSRGGCVQSTAASPGSVSSSHLSVIIRFRTRERHRPLVAMKIVPERPCESVRVRAFVCARAADAAMPAGCLRGGCSSAQTDRSPRWHRFWHRRGGSFCGKLTSRHAQLSNRQPSVSPSPFWAPPAWVAPSSVYGTQTNASSSSFPPAVSASLPPAGPRPHPVLYRPGQCHHCRMDSAGEG